MRLTIAKDSVRAALFAALAGFCADARAQPRVHPAPTESISVDAQDDVAGEFRTTNFVVHGTTRGVARRLAERAERHRKELAKVWLGKELPNWASPCRVDVQLNQGRLGGLSTFDFQNQAAVWVPVRINLSGNVDGILCNTLPHEMTHAVLADHFRRPLPRWADEGTAIICEADEVQKRFDRMAREFGQQWQLYRLVDLFAMREYPPRLDIFYAEGYSVTRFLVDRKDRPTFLSFLQTGMCGDWNAAAKQCYGFESVDDMQTAWLATLAPKK